ncbi:MAG: sporulation protein YqfD [Clostridia bacterium]|nr:sporulation protein YqfD [Clostridia bacterium]
MNRLYRAVLGYEKLIFSSSEPERILNFALQYNIPLWGIEKCGSEISFFVSRPARRHFRAFEEKLWAKESIRWEKRGSIRFFARFGKRIGFYLGIVLFFAMLSLSTRFVWSVQVKGQEKFTENEIRERLKEIGIAPGVLKKDINTSEAALLFQVDNPEFSFLSVNLIGTVARIEVREREAVDKTKPEDHFSNQVAEIAGKIVRYEVLAGEILVNVGESVPQGTLLISGVRENKSGGFSALDAKGRVFAETERCFKEIIPFSRVETLYTGREKVRDSYEILGFSFGNDSLSDPPFTSFETMEIVEDVSLFGKELPITRKSLVFLETEEKNEVVTVDRAKILAYDKYEEYKRDIFAFDDVILEENVTFSENESAVTITAKILAIEDICQEKPFFYNASFLLN